MLVPVFVPSGQCCRRWRCLHGSLRCAVLCCFAFPVFTSPACLLVSSCLPLSFRVHAPSHRSLSRKTPALTDAAYACQPNTLASRVFVSILARERSLRHVSLSGCLYKPLCTALPHPTDWLIAETNGSAGTASAKCLVLVPTSTSPWTRRDILCLRVCARLCKTGF